MDAILFLNIYYEQNEARRKELEICYKNNFMAGFNEIWVVVEKKDEQYSFNLVEKYIYDSPTQINIRVVSVRPAFQVYIDLANKYPIGTLNVVMNSDIYIENTELEKLKNLPWKERKLFLGLSRYDVGPEGAFLLERSDSQDGFIWYGHSNVVDASCPLGYCGIDNSICYKFKEMGYHVVNPSKSLQLMHLHLVLGNNYRQNGFGNIKADNICPAPYYFPIPCLISEI